MTTSTATPTSTATLTHETAPTQYVELDGVRHGYRVFGQLSTVPLVLLQHLTGTMDNWDPAVTNGLAQRHLVVLFDNTGVGSSGGQVPPTVAEMAWTIAAFIAALGYEQVDLLGFSMGGFIAQQVTLNHPALVRRLILVGTSPRGQSTASVLAALQGGQGKPPLELMLHLFYEQSETSRQLGRASLQRMQSRTTDRTPATAEQAVNAQVAAILHWGEEPDPDFSQVRPITQPVLVVNGRHDIVILTVNSWLLYQHLPNAQLSLYPDSGHGSLFQYPDLFVEQATYFLGQK